MGLDVFDIYFCALKRIIILILVFEIRIEQA